jgi:hypothetical protein
MEGICMDVELSYLNIDLEIISERMNNIVFCGYCKSAIFSHIYLLKKHFQITYWISILSFVLTITFVRNIYFKKNSATYYYKWTYIFM